MQRLPTLDEIADECAALSEAEADARVAALLADADDEKWTFGLMLKASLANQRKGPDAAIAELRKARQRLGCMPMPVIFNALKLWLKSDREQEAAHECATFAKDAMAMGYPDLALEAASAAVILDSRGSFEILKTPAASLEIAELYERISGLLPAPAAPAPRSSGPPWNVTLVVSNIVDHVVAHTKTLCHFARYADRKLYKLNVVSSENLAGRISPIFPFCCAEFPSEKTGAKAIAELRSIDIPVKLLPRNVSFKQAATMLNEFLAASGAHIAVFQCGLASPIDWLAARMAPVPCKAAIHIGSSLFNNGARATFFDNPVNIEREKAFWPSTAGARILLPLGVDIDELDRQTPISRAKLGIPENAVVIGTLSNHLVRRLSEPFLRLLAEALAAHPDAVFVAFGPGDLACKLEPFKARGVADRVIFAGRQLASGSALKLLDIYVNEFPVGGCVAVLEAMSSGVPVLAMRAGDAHAESAAAAAVGEPFAIQTNDPAAYACLLDEWLKNPNARQQAGDQMRARALQRFHVRDYVAQLLAHCVKLARF